MLGVLLLSGRGWTWTLLHSTVVLLFLILLFLEPPSDFINVGVEQTLKVTLTFFVAIFFVPQRKTFSV